MRKLLLTLALAILGPVAAHAQASFECNIISAASTNSTNCTALPAVRYRGVVLYNTTTTVGFLRLYNATAAPTCSSATGFIKSIPVVPASAAGQVGQTVVVLQLPVIYQLGLGFCLTGGSSSTDNTNSVVGIFGTIMYSVGR